MARPMTIDTSTITYSNELNVAPASEETAPPSVLPSAPACGSDMLGRGRSGTCSSARRRVSRQPCAAR